ncbi:M28 family metallopeptidase [Enterococcus faecalis]|uniref:M28 family metallopeptidase n=1 Tax=Enterococcus faecalis TaxID=1351 RepID=UPI001F599249|nr:M28 family metallopeptidase [Enterococcus faecalis]
MKKLLILFSFFLFLTACTSNESKNRNNFSVDQKESQKNKENYLSSNTKNENVEISNNISQYTIEELIQYFEKLGSREVGGKVNALAGQVIAKFWKQLDILPYYSRTYYQKFKTEDEITYFLSAGSKYSFSGSAENIVGKIEGMDTSKAVVLSAHFDTFPGVKGLIDNTSGTVGLMDLSRKINMVYQDKKPPINIIFVAFNGEEFQLAGSKSFYKQLNKSYKRFYNINLDCIGKKNSALSYGIDNEKSKLLASDLKKYLDANGVKLNNTKYDEQGSSDHAIFWENKRAAMIIGNELPERFVHTAKDNVSSSIDYEEINKIVRSISQFIINTNGKMY